MSLLYYKLNNYREELYISTRFDDGSKDHHGGKTILKVEEFELKDYPDEYLISVEGNYDVVDEGYYKSESEVILMLRFKTSKQTSPTFGTEVGTSFILEKENHKIVGFHGKSSTTLHQLGSMSCPLHIDLII
ncbi:hypothetical protein EUTSA_v10012365mg [Eutrema salsugineum]|uniref:Jacalin-type lectin domain-containing protein n=1 Tax=Eutrema salsugineum TaxID=72664 RepID=V4MG06_EUTSA|nr:hypothetical protein EUTSA_v10012365mg [Eutrema salsugineum]